MDTFFSRVSQRFRNNYLLVFALLWFILFVLYLPAAKAGWVSDTVMLLQKIRHGTFWTYINLKESRGNIYPFSGGVFYLLYQLFGTNPWPWHLLFLTLQATNATLLFVVFIKLFDESGVENGFIIASGSTILFCICPHISEVMVWKASYHYLQAMLIILWILYLVQKFHTAPSAKKAWCVGILFIFSTLSDEFYFLTPIFVFTLIVYYHTVLGYGKVVFKKGLLYFFLPLCIIIFVRLALATVTSGPYAADAGDEMHLPLASYLRKPPLYLFHTVFFGRFLPNGIKQWVYDFFAAKKGIAVFYGLLAIIWIYILARFRKMTAANKVFVLVFIWVLPCMALVSTVWFPEILLVNFDRYAYFMLPFIYILLVYFLTKLRFEKLIFASFAIYALINVYYTLKVNNYWRHSANIANHLLHAMPPTDDKTVLLLNAPEYMNGVPMIGPFLHFSFRQMCNLYNERQINNTMYDVVSYNMAGKGDGAHVSVINDSTVHVTLNQWGTWWWANMVGASSYENKDYKFNLVDPGHWYELILKHPSSQYLLLFQVGDQLKTVDMGRKNEDQY